MSLKNQQIKIVFKERSTVGCCNKRRTISRSPRSAAKCNGV